MSTPNKPNTLEKIVRTSRAVAFSLGAFGLLIGACAPSSSQIKPNNAVVCEKKQGNYKQKHFTSAHELLKKGEGLVTEQHYRGLDYLIEEARKRLSKIGGKVGRGVPIKGEADAVAVLSTINNILKENVSHLNYVFEECRAAFVYKAIAEVMDLPLDVIREPGHFFVRVEYGNSNYLEWDPMKGRKIPNFFPEKLAEIRYKKIKDQFREAVKNGVYYKALTRKEISAVHDDIIGSMWFNKGHIDKAIKLFEKAVYLYPAFAEAFYHLGNAQNKKAALLAQNGNLEDAFIVFNQALQNHVKSIELSPTFPEPYRGIGNTLVRKAHIFMKFNDYDKTFTNLNMAIKSYNKALEEYPNFPRVRDDLDNVMAKTYNNMGIAFVGKAHVLMNYGDFKGALKNFNKAIGFYDESLSLNPECSEAHGAKELALKRKKTLMYKMNKKLSRAQLSKHPN